MIRGYSINLMHLLDTHTRFRVMDLVVETIRRTAMDQKRSCGYAPYIKMLINDKLGKHAHLVDPPHLPLQPEFEDNEVLMDDNDPNSVVTRMTAHVDAARNRPPLVPQLRTPAEKMVYLVRTIQGMEKNIQEILQNHKSLERVVETKFHNMDVKITELTTIVRQLQHEVDSVEIPRSEDEDEDEDDDDEDDSPPPTTTRFSTKPRSAVVLAQ
ncbi:pumilio-like protein 1 [Hordeum vulgare]|nr:pumilio-like protein 1 [Hordeum vulgare]